jgi:hypothetical protein
MLTMLVPLAHAGTAIGHPDIHHGSGGALVFTTFEVYVERLGLRRCSGEPVTVTVEAVLAEGDALELPAGCFDRLRIDTAWVEATGTGLGGTFELDLAPGQIDVVLEGDIAIPGTLASALALASDGWVTASMLGLGTGVHRHVDATDELYVPLGRALRDDSTLTF